MSSTGALKWKPRGEIHDENTIDVMLLPFEETATINPVTFEGELYGFQQEVGRSGMYMVARSRLEGKVQFSSLEVPPGIQVRSGAVYEVAWNHIERKWDLKYERQKHANTIETVEKTLINILQNLQLEDVIKIK